MAKGFVVTEEIASAPDLVWAALTDPARMPLWMGSIAKVRPADPRPLAEGSRLITTLASARGKGQAREARIVAWEPESRFALASEEGGVSAIYEYRCAPSQHGTRVTLDARCTARGFPWRLLHPLIAYLMARSDGGQLKALKRLVETG